MHIDVWDMNRLNKGLGSVLIFVLTACTSWHEAVSHVDVQPPVFPDYKDVTVPCNIAPLNFMVEGTDRIQVVITIDGEEGLKVAGKDGVISIPLKKWRGLLDRAHGKVLQFEVSVWSDESPEGTRYAPFTVNVAPESMDPWISYRLIEPGYVGWRQLGIYQRDVSSFEESAIVTNRSSNTTCINCHHYPSYSPESMMFHARGANGGTILYDRGRLKKIDFRNKGPKKNTTYPAWHPNGRYIAFSSNVTHQVFFSEGRQPIEVFDTASDLVLYDINSDKVIVDPRFMTEASLETFPSWAPDGRSLYFASYSSPVLPVVFNKHMHYDLLRVPFDPESGTFGEKIDTLFNTRVSGGSVSYPRVSPDGSRLLYTWSEYGTFPIWHQEADLKLMDLSTGNHVDVSVWNDTAAADSYHSWSSEGRWVMFGSRRIDGRYTRLYIAYLDPQGKPHKPFLLPQEDPRFNSLRLKSFNVPEFMSGKVTLPKDVSKLLDSEY